MSTSKRRTPFFNNHVAAKARIIDFGGWEMPVQYTGIIDEHLRVRTTAGLFDVSHMGEVEVRGDNAFDFVQRITVNDVAQLAVGQVQYSCMCTETGGIVDDLLVYRMPDHFLIVVNASNTDKDFQWMTQNNKEGVELHNISNHVAQLALQGPKAQEILLKLTSVDLDKIPFYWYVQGEVMGLPMIISRTGYTGEDGFELYFQQLNRAGDVWNGLMDAGKHFNIQPIGLGARDTLRLEMKYALYGNDIDDTTTPLEAGLAWITKLNKGLFTGRDALLAQKEKGVPRKLICFEIEGKSVARQGFTVFKDGEEIGKVCSGTFSPSLQKVIGTAYVKSGCDKSGTALEIDIRGKRAPGVVVKPPFYKDATHR